MLSPLTSAIRHIFLQISLKYSNWFCHGSANLGHWTKEWFLYFLKNCKRQNKMKAEEHGQRLHVIHKAWNIYLAALYRKGVDNNHVLNLWKCYNWALSSFLPLCLNYLGKITEGLGLAIESGKISLMIYIFIAFYFLHNKSGFIFPLLPHICLTITCPVHQTQQPIITSSIYYMFQAESQAL